MDPAGFVCLGSVGCPDDRLNRAASAPAAVEGVLARGISFFPRGHPFSLLR